MAAYEADVVAQRQQLFLDRSDKGFVVAPRQIGAADRAVEQDVADMGEFCRAIVEHDMPRRMTRTVQHLEIVSGERNSLALLQIAVGRAVADRIGQAEHLSLAFQIREQ